MADFNDLKSALSLRRAAKGGPNRSSDINDTHEEILHDLAELFHFVNTTIVPVLNGLGAPGTYADINAVTQGLDGRTILTDKDFADTNNIFFYNAAQGRPKTIKETTLKLTQDANSLFAAINTINARLGAIDQDENTNPATLAEIENSLNFFINLVNTINTNTTGFLTASGIATGLNDGSIDPASFGIDAGDILINAGLRPTDVSGIDLLVAYDYTGGIPDTYDLTDSVMRVKEFIEDVSGDTIGLDSDSVTLFENSGLSGDSLKTHREKVGTGTATTTNPHGLDVSDLGDSTSVTARLTQVASFDVKISGLLGVLPSGVGEPLLPQPAPINYAGGYEYVPATYTVTRVAGTVTYGGTTGLTIGIYRRRSDVNEFIYSGLAIPAANPGDATATAGFANTDLIAGDLIFVSGLSGDANDARVFVWGTPG
jgi:hypothetical protein